MLGKLNIQQMIDDQLAARPDLARYVGQVRYVPQGAPVPDGATHTLKVVSVANGQELVVAMTVGQPYATIADVLLGVL